MYSSGVMEVCLQFLLLTSSFSVKTHKRELPFPSLIREQHFRKSDLEEASPPALPNPKLRNRSRAFAFVGGVQDDLIVFPLYSIRRAFFPKNTLQFRILTASFPPFIYAGDASEFLNHRPFDKRSSWRFW